MLQSAVSKHSSYRFCQIIHTSKSTTNRIFQRIERIEATLQHVLQVIHLTFNASNRHWNLLARTGIDVSLVVTTDFFRSDEPAPTRTRWMKPFWGTLCHKAYILTPETQVRHIMNTQKDLRRRNHAIRILLLPAIIFLFTIGWLLYCEGRPANRSILQGKITSTQDDGIQMQIVTFQEAEE